MNAEEYLKQELSNRELWGTETDDCYQVLAEIIQDYVQSHISKLEARNKELENALEKIIKIEVPNFSDDYKSDGYQSAINDVSEIAEQALNKKS